MSEAGTCPSMTYPPTSAVWQDWTAFGTWYFVLTVVMFSTFVAVGANPLARRCSTHFAQHPQVALL